MMPVSVSTPKKGTRPRTPHRGGEDGWSWKVQLIVVVEEEVVVVLVVVVLEMMMVEVAHGTEKKTTVVTAPPVLEGLVLEGLALPVVGDCARVIPLAVFLSVCTHNRRGTRDPGPEERMLAGTSCSYRPL